MNNYPKNRKKKIPHEQYRATEKVLNFGQPVDKYFMVYHKGWWACIEGDKGSARIILNGKQYTKIAKVTAYLGANGDEIFGYYRVYEREHKSASGFYFCFVKEPHPARVIQRTKLTLKIECRPKGKQKPVKTYKKKVRQKYPLKQAKFKAV